MLKTIALTAMLTLGTVATASAFYEFDGSGAPINMHLVDVQSHLDNIYASTRDPETRSVAPFTAEEKAFFDRTSKPYHEGWNGVR